MATSDPVRLLQEEVTCAVCLDYLHEPVTIDCGHNFCRACITRCWDEMGRRFPCPQCRARSPKRKLRPNCQLANVAMAAKRLRPNVSEDGELGPGGSAYKSLDTREPEEELVSTLAEEEEEARGIQAYETPRAPEDKPQEPQEARDRELEPESLPGTARETEGEPEPRVDNRREEAPELEAREPLEAERREAQDGRPQKGPMDGEEGQSGGTEGQPQNHQEDPAHETRWPPKEVTLEGEEEKAKGSFEIKPEKTPQEEEDVVGSSRPASSEVSGQRAELRLERNVPQSFCPQHPGEELWLFCRWDGATLCPSCEPERAHEGHDLVVLDEEGQAAKARLRGALDRLRAQKEALEDAGIRQERQVIHLGEEAALRRQRLGDEFEELRHFLSKAEHDLLNSLTTAEHQAQAARRARGARLWANAQRLDRLLLEASAWLLLPSARLLGDSNVQEGLRNLEAEASRNLGARVIPGEGLGGAGRAQAVLKEAARAFRERLLGELDRDEPPVRFDTNSAAPGLEVSEGRRTVKLTPRVSTQQADLCPCILGDKAWQDGSHYWEVDVSQSGGWAVGVASDSNPRPQPNRGLWALQLSKGQLWTPEVTLAVRQQPRRLAIYLEVEAGLLAFSDAQSGAPVHSYQGADWGPNANLRPCFWLWDLGGCLRLSP